MKRIFAALIFILILSQALAEPPRLKASGGQFFTSNGSAVQLKGINWAEPWLCDEEDMAEVKSWGVNVVRLWCHEGDLLKELGRIDGKPSFSITSVTQWARTNDVYVILVLGDMKNTAANKVKPWANHSVKERIRTFWKIVAEKTADNPAVLGYELMNEPSIDKIKQDAYRNFAEDISNSIRSIAPNTTVIIPGPTRLDRWEPPYFFKINLDNVAYSYTFWDPYAFTHASPRPVTWPASSAVGKPWLAKKIKTLASSRQALNAPVIVAEFGAAEYALGDSELKWVQDVTSLLQEKEIPGIYWSYKSYRASSFHLYYNEIDREIPVNHQLWQKMLVVLKEYWKS